MDVSTALNRIEVVLNQYQAFAELKDALEAAVHAEQRVVECGIRETALRESIAVLETQVAAVEAHLDVVGDARMIEADVAIAAKEVEFQTLVEKCRGAEKVLADVDKEIDAIKATHAAEIGALEAKVADMKAKAEAEELRLQIANAALDNLKALL